MKGHQDEEEAEIVAGGQYVPDLRYSNAGDLNDQIRSFHFYWDYR